jgi:hypothetical protein
MRLREINSPSGALLNPMGCASPSFRHAGASQLTRRRATVSLSRAGASKRALQQGCDDTGHEVLTVLR